MTTTKKVFFILLAIVLIGALLLALELRSKIQTSQQKQQLMAEEEKKLDAALQTDDVLPESLPPSPLKELFSFSSLQERDAALQQTEEVVAAAKSSTAPEDPSLPLLSANDLSFDKNEHGAKLTSMRTTRSSDACTILEPAANYIHPNCSLFTYDDKRQSAVLFDQKILRERLDFKEDGKTPAQKIIIHENGRNIKKQIVYLPGGKRKELTFATNGRLTEVLLQNAQQQTQQIMYMAYNDFSLPGQLIMDDGKQKITYSLSRNSKYEKTVYLNNEMTQAPPPIGWKLNEKGQALLEDGQTFPSRDFWGPTPRYCSLYPYDCITK